MLARHTGDSAKVAEARERCLQMSRDHLSGHDVARLLCALYTHPFGGNQFLSTSQP
jgi:hypothetical protein